LHLHDISNNARVAGDGESPKKRHQTDAANSFEKARAVSDVENCKVVQSHIYTYKYTSSDDDRSSVSSASLSRHRSPRSFYRLNSSPVAHTSVLHLNALRYDRPCCLSRFRYCHPSVSCTRRTSQFQLLRYEQLLCVSLNPCRAVFLPFLLSRS
jgi:hypothetical protein